jgi:hypothetical protein
MTFGDIEFTAEEIAWCEWFDETIATIRKVAAARPAVREILGEEAAAKWLRGEPANLSKEQQKAVMALCKDLLE